MSRSTIHARRDDRPGPATDRRGALELLAAGLALSLGACGKPNEEIVPYVDMPERLVPGIPLRFASTLPLSGYGRGVTCISREGRPIKVEGNRRHPASLGATDVFAEADILGLYDPDRSQTVRQGGQISSWDAFVTTLLPQLDRHAAAGGAGLRLLTGRITSPTLVRQMGELRQRFPALGWHRYEPVDDDHARQGSVLAFARPLTALPDLARADTILALDADPLGPGPDQLRLARGFAQRRAVRRDSPAPLRLYAAEPALTLTGAAADHRLALRPEAIGAMAMALAAALDAGLQPPELPTDARRFIDAAARDLTAHKGRALVLVGPGQPPAVHALAHWINARLAAPVGFIEPVDLVGEDHGASLAALAADMAAGRVTGLVILGCNPAYNAPVDLGFAEALATIPFTVHAGPYLDETAAACDWHLPAPHPLESWADLRAVDGTASIVQPLIQPLYASRTASEVLALLQGRLDASPYTALRETWAGHNGAAEFDAWWRQALHDGVIAGSAAEPVTPPEPRLPALDPEPPPPGLTLVLRPDPTVWDGAYANNAWLQECPKPLTKQVWGNAALLAPADAAALGLADGDVARLGADGRYVEAPIMVAPGQAAGVVALTLGYGRRRAGEIGSGLGVDAYAMRTTAHPWTVPGLAIAPAGAHQNLVRAQLNFDLAGRDAVLPVLSLADLAKAAAEPESREPPPSLYPPYAYDDHAWAMVIDTTLCIGCNACVVACQAENNIPVVGPVEIARGRVMHWIRIDTYRLGEGAHPVFQPVPCMHCEHAPCEPVCPVEASVHDHEGLNVQVYNRCIGTRFCEANCPYKVRRFNFYAYANGQEFANLGTEIVAAQHNPEVTVRGRGVMEKCTYCVQRISRARQDAERDDRPIAAGEVVTACQAACPTSAIIFGDLNAEGSAVNRLRAEPQHYALLGELGTRPRTTYLARIRNADPDLDWDQA